MEEEKKEECCFGHNGGHHKCCGCKIGKVLLLLVIIAIIFSLGVLVGSCHNNREKNSIRFGEFNNQPRNGGRIMKNGGDFSGRRSGGCFQEVNTQAGIPSCPMQAQNQIKTPSSSVPVK